MQYAFNNSVDLLTLILYLWIGVQVAEAVDYASVILTDEGAGDEERITTFIGDALQELEQNRFIRYDERPDVVYLVCRSKYAEKST